MRRLKIKTAYPNVYEKFVKAAKRMVSIDHGKFGPQAEMTMADYWFRLGVRVPNEIPKYYAFLDIGDVPATAFAFRPLVLSG